MMGSYCPYAWISTIRCTRDIRKWDALKILSLNELAEVAPRQQFEI